MQWITCGWPGLSRLWLQGQWAGLAVAAGFGVIFNLAVVMQLKLSGQVPETVQQSVWLLTAIFWVGGCFEGILTTRDFRRQQQLQLKRNSTVVDTGFKQMVGANIRSHNYHGISKIDHARLTVR